MNRGIAIFMIAAALSVMASLSVFAQTSSLVNIQPAFPRVDNERTKSIFVHKVSFGEVIEDGVLIINNNITPQTIRIYAADYKQSNSGGFACKQYGELDDEVGSWISVNTENVTIQPGTVELVSFSITVPSTASAGENNACIVAEPVLDASELTEKEGITVLTRSAIRVALLVPGELTKSIRIEEFDIAREEKKVLFVPTLINDGSVSADVDVTIRTHPILGTGFTETAGTFAILRDTTRKLRMELSDPPFWGGWYDAELLVRYDPNPDTVVGIRDMGNLVTVSAEASRFFVAPKPFALAIISLGAISVIIFFAGRFVAFERQHKISLTWDTYKILEGDDIKKIATQFGISWRVLARVNDIKAPYTVKAGTNIRAPQVGSKNESEGTNKKR